MTQELKTDNSSFDKELGDKIVHVIAVNGMYARLKNDEPIEQAYFAIACTLAHIIATNDEAAMQELRDTLKAAEAHHEVAKGVSNG